MTKPERRTKRIAIVGASGRTGRELVERAVAKGHGLPRSSASPTTLLRILRAQSGTEARANGVVVATYEPDR